MNPKLPIATARELIKVLKKAGFYEYHQKGSHLTLVRDSDDNQVTIPIHPGKTLGKGLLNKILRQTGLTIEEFNKLR
jgi:predicted RNA binding protein YcfA (HicA-like mRNA interferase family)